MGVLAAVLLACAATGSGLPDVARAASTTVTQATSTPTSSDQLSATLMQTISQFDQLSADLAQNQQQQASLQAQVSGDKAQIQQLNQRIKSLSTQEAHLAVIEQQERTQLPVLERAIYIDPWSVLISALQTGGLSSYLTQNPSHHVAVNRANKMADWVDSLRRQAQASRVSLGKQRAGLTADEQKNQASQKQLAGLATQLQSQQTQVEGQWTQAMLEVAAQKPDATLTAQQTAEMATLGTGGLDQQTLNAGLASGMYTLSTSTIQWPAQPDPTPLGLAQYPGYCQYTPVQCTCYAANAFQKYTGGVLPQHLGNGGQWISGAQAAGIQTSLTPTEGSVVVFNGPRYSAFGHVALVRSVIYGGGAEIGLVVWERNLDEMGGFDVRLVALGSGSEIAGYIPPGA